MKINKNFILKFFLIVIFLASFLLMIFSGSKDSQTTDEAIHLFSGYTYLTQRDFRLDPEHPPLLKELGALPLLFFRNINVVLDKSWDKAANFYYDSWYEARILGKNFFYVWNNPENILFWGRFPFIILTLILGYLGYIWAKKLYGSKAGLFAAFLILFFPNILAHGRLVNTDLGLTLFIFLTVYLWGNFLKKPNFLNVCWVGTSLGLVLASKFTGIIIVPILLILLLIKSFFFNQEKQFFKYLLCFLEILFLAFVVVWASYGFSFKIPPIIPVSFTGEYLWSNLRLTPSLAIFLDKIRVLLLPAEFYKGIFLLFRHATAGHGSFLLGETSSSGWWYYFPITIFYKTPIPIFFFLIFSIGYWRKLRAKEFFDEFLLIVPLLGFLIFSMFSKADLGVRHILPIFPFLLVFISKSINLINFSQIKMNFRKLLWPIAFFILIGWYLISALMSFPNYLAYFNEFAGGSKGGYKILTDSNLDWGQDIYRLKKYLDDHNIKKVSIVYPWNGDIALEYYGINFEPLTPDEKDVQGPVVISATYLQTDAYAWLKKYPFEQITPGVFVFHLN